MSDRNDTARMAAHGFGSFAFDDGRYRHLVFDKGHGPVVIVMHELPGLCEPAVRFADRLVTAGFHVYLPLLFGEAMDRAPGSNYLKLCISKEFAQLRANVSAPVCDWLRALARKLGGNEPGTRIGVIGMCLTGAFVIPMVLETAVGAGVISQPSVPFSFSYRYLGIGKGEWMQEINVAHADLAAAARRAQQDDVHVIVQHFLDDRLCPPQRIERIARQFGGCAKSYHFAKPSPKSDSPHAVLTEEYDEATDEAEHPTRIALRQVVAFLHAQLRNRAAEP